MISLKICDNKLPFHIPTAFHRISNLHLVIATNTVRVSFPAEAISQITRVINFTENLRPWISQICMSNCANCLMKLDVTGNQANKNKQQCLAKRSETRNQSIQEPRDFQMWFLKLKYSSSDIEILHMYLLEKSFKPQHWHNHAYREPNEFWRGVGIGDYDEWMQFVIGIPDASQCSPPGLAARRRRFLTLTPPWQESLVGLGRGVEVVRRGDEDWGEAETGRSGEGGNWWVFLSWHWLRWIDSFSRGLWNKRDFISAVTPL